MTKCLQLQVGVGYVQQKVNHTRICRALKCKYYRFVVTFVSNADFTSPLQTNTNMYQWVQGHMPLVGVNYWLIFVFSS